MGEIQLPINCPRCMQERCHYNGIQCNNCLGIESGRFCTIWEYLHKILVKNLNDILKNRTNIDYQTELAHDSFKILGHVSYFNLTPKESENYDPCSALCLRCDNPRGCELECVSCRRRPINMHYVMDNDVHKELCMNLNNLLESKFAESSLNLVQSTINILQKLKIVDTAPIHRMLVGDHAI